MYAALEEIERQYTANKVVELYKLKREEYVCLFRLSEGYSTYDVAAECNVTPRTVQNWQKSIARKFRTAHFYQAMFEFGLRQA